MPLVKIDTETTTVRKETPDHQVMCSPYSKPPINIAKSSSPQTFTVFPANQQSSTPTLDMVTEL